MRGFFDQLSLRKIVTRRTNREPVTVVYGDSYDIRPYKVSLPTPSLQATQEEESLLKLKYIEGSARAVRLGGVSDRFIRDAVEGDPELGAIWGMLESDTAQRDLAQKYKGDASNIKKGNKVLTKSISDQLTDTSATATVYDPRVAQAADKIALAKCVLNRVRAKWEEGNPANALELNLSDASAEILDKVSQTDLMDALALAGGTKDTLRLAEKLREAITPPTPDEEPPPEDGEGEGEGEPSGEGEGEPSGEGEGEPSGEGEGESEPSNEDENEPSNESENEDEPSDEGKNEPSNESEPDGEGEPDDTGDDTGALDERAVFEALDKLHIGDISGDSEKKEPDAHAIPRPALGDSSRIKVIDMAETFPAAYEAMKADADNIVADCASRTKALANQIRKHLLAVKRSKIQTNRKQGKLHNRNLFRVAAPMQGDGTWNSKVFKKKIEGKELNTSVTILVDSSGSMSGRKIELAAEAAVSLDHVFSRVLKIPVEILSFAANRREGYNGIIKAFNAPASSGTIAARIITFYNHYYAGNHDANALLWGATRAMTRREERNIVIVLSDGQPTRYIDAVNPRNANIGNMAHDALIMVCDQLKQQKNVELYGIGILSSCVVNYYGENTQVLMDVNDLPAVLLTTVKNGVLA